MLLVSKTYQSQTLDTEFCFAAVWRRVPGRPVSRGGRTSRISARFIVRAAFGMPRRLTPRVNWRKEGWEYYERYSPSQKAGRG